MEQVAIEKDKLLSSAEICRDLAKIRGRKIPLATFKRWKVACGIRSIGKRYTDGDRTLLMALAKWLQRGGSIDGWRSALGAGGVPKYRKSDALKPLPKVQALGDGLGPISVSESCPDCGGNEFEDVWLGLGSVKQCVACGGLNHGG